MVKLIKITFYLHYLNFKSWESLFYTKACKWRASCFHLSFDTAAKAHKLTQDRYQEEARMKAPRPQYMPDLWEAQGNLSPSICLVCPLYIEAQPLQWLRGSGSHICTALQLALTVAQHLVYFLKLFRSLKWQENRIRIANKSWNHSNFPDYPKKLGVCAKATKIKCNTFWRWSLDIWKELTGLPYN